MTAAMPVPPVRLSVNMNPETAAAVREIAETNCVNVTETVRRVVAIAHFVEGEFRAGKQIVIRDPTTGLEQEMVIG